jgi:curved DNA-binding protein CbpA
MPVKDYYRLLGVAPDESAAGIRTAYRDAVRRTHPDRAGAQSAPDFQDIVEAHEVLSDPARRKLYDETLERARKPVQPAFVPVTAARAPNAEAPEGLAIEVMLTPEEALMGVVRVDVPIRGRMEPLVVRIPPLLRMGIVDSIVLTPFRIGDLIVRIGLEVLDEEF